jgi:putative ABC transport system ATP-binding protein
MSDGRADGRGTPSAALADAELEARAIGRRLRTGDGWLFRNLSFALRRGERVALLGPSGAGKTVLLRALALLDPLAEGEILWRGHPVARDQVPAFRAEAVYVHQRPALVANDVEAELRGPFALRVHRGRQFDRGRLIAQLEGLGRDAAFLGKPVAELSGGEAQLTALLRALQLDPALLLLDEPTASLDPESARAIERLVDQWFIAAPGQRAFLWVTHNPDQAERVARKTVLMESGGVLVEPKT